MRKKLRGALRPLAALVLALCLMASAQTLAGAAERLDLSKECSLKVTPGSVELAEDLENANVVVDLYKVAAAEKTPGYDTYGYEMESGFEALTVDPEINNEGWRALAQQAAGIALGGGGMRPTATATDKDTFPGLECGLYLVIAHGSDLEDYVTHVKEKDAEGKETETELLATVANSPTKRYTFLPELVSLPSKGQVGEDGNWQAGTTADRTDWTYDLSVTLKPEQNQRYGSLEIQKTLRGYVVRGEARDPATFVFQVEGTIEGEVVYSNVISVDFDAAGTKTVTLTDIPAGATVTVTEVYSGASYTVVGSDTQSPGTVAAEEVLHAAFENEYNGEHKEGHGILNHFTYEGGAWDWQQGLE